MRLPGASIGQRERIARFLPAAWRARVAVAAVAIAEVLYPPELGFGIDVPPALQDEVRLVPDDISSTPAQRAYVARLDGEVVAATQSVAADGVLGVFGVAVVPDARRRGVGSAIAAHVIADRGAGTTPAVLESSAMGEGVYERLGFRTLMTREAWVRPEPSR